MKMRAVLALSTMLAAFHTTPAKAQWAVFDASNFAQAIQTFQQLQQAASYAESQLQAVQDQFNYVQNVVNLAIAPEAQIWGQAQADLNMLNSLVNQANSLTYMASDLAQQFQTAYPGMPASAQITGNYASLIKSSQSAQQTALQSASLNVSQMAGERATIQSIQASSAGATGALQAAQAGNMLTSQVVDQLQKTRLLIADQISAESNAAAASAQDRANAMSDTQKLMPAYVPNTTPNDGAIGGLTAGTKVDK